MLLRRKNYNPASLRSDRVADLLRNRRPISTGTRGRFHRNIHVAKVAANNWCVDPSCGKCGFHGYRLALRNLGGAGGELLRHALIEIDPHELMCLPYWDFALAVALQSISSPEHLNEILDAWLPRVGLALAFDDAVLFRTVRYLPATLPTRGRWIRSAIHHAISSRYESLVETLLIVLGPSARRYPELLAVAQELAPSSKQIARVLRNVAGPTPA